LQHFYKSTFGIGDRFQNAHSYLKNNPSLTGRLKRYSSSRNIFQNKTHIFFDNINTKRTINPSLSVNLDDRNKSRKKFHKLSNLNNKSSSSINPEYFNPLINYKSEDKICKKQIKRNYVTNKDHFINMIPTQIYKYTPHTKRGKYNYYSISQIDNIPGSNPNLNRKINFKKTGKKTFSNNMFEESKGYNGRNNKFQNRMKRNVLNNRQFSQVYEFDNPIISYMDMNKKNNN
jgi:hypothetical protein